MRKRVHGKAWIGGQGVWTRSCMILLREGLGPTAVEVVTVLAVVRKSCSRSFRYCGCLWLGLACLLGADPDDGVVGGPPG